MKLLILICGLFATVFANHDSGHGASYGGGDHADHKAAHAVTAHHAAHHAKHTVVAHHGHDDHKAAAHHGHVHVHHAPAAHGSHHDHHGHRKKHAAPAHHGHDHKAAAHGVPVAHGSHHGLSNHPSSHKAADKSKSTEAQIKKIHDYVISNDYQAKIAKAASKVRVSGAIMYKHLLKHKKTTSKNHDHKTDHHAHKKPQSKRTTGPLHKYNYFEAPAMYKHLGPIWSGAPKQFETPYAYHPGPSYERGYNMHHHNLQHWDIEEPKYGPKPHLGFPFSGHHEPHMDKPDYSRPPRPYEQSRGPIYKPNQYQPQPYGPVRNLYNESPKSPNPYPNGPFARGKVDYEPRPAEPRYEPEQYKPRSYEPHLGHFETPYYH